MAHFPTQAAALARLDNPAPLALPVAVAALARLGFELKRDDDSGLILKPARAADAAAVYCDDVADAVDSALDMLARKSAAARGAAELRAIGVPARAALATATAATAA